MKHSTCVSWTEHGEKRTREGTKSGIGRLERMKHGNGTKGRYYISIVIIKILITDQCFAPDQTDGLRKITKQTARRKRN
jgi:hypothetical protein